MPKTICRGVEVVQKFKVSLTAGQWQLYLPESAEEAQLIAAAVREVNKAVERHLNGEIPLQEVHTLMGKYSKFGFCDSEPYWKLENIITKATGGDNLVDL